MATPQTTVREIALESPASIRVFENFGIDYCCGGNKPLTQACEEHSIDLEAVLTAIENATQAAPQQAYEWKTASLESICAHIVNTHHAYIRAELPRLNALAERVMARHGDTRPELGQIQRLIESVGDDLLQHLSKEEMMLFPYIVNLERSTARGGPQAAGCFGSVRNPIRVMMTEHDAAGSAMAEIRQLSNGFDPPAGACPTYRGFYQSLSEFERDLHQHVHLENNMLFPRAIKLEESRG